MKISFSHTSKVTKLIITLQFVLVAYLLYTLTKSLYDGYTVDQYIEQIQAENEKLALENQQKIEDYLYFSSDEYIDKIAKQNSGAVNPGEKVIIITDSGFADEVNEDYLDLPVARYEEVSKPRQWVNFFFKD